MRRVHPLFLLTLILPLSADWRDDTGYNEFLVLAGANPPDGSGIFVLQSEASVVNMDPRFFTPDETNSQLDTKNFTIETPNGTPNSPTANSFHATTVARYFFGNQITSSGINSVAPGVTDIYVYEANTYLSDLVNNQISPTRKVHSNAWVGDDLDTNRQLILGLSDTNIKNNEFLTIGGLRNSSSEVLPDAYSNLLNGLTIGKSDGNHSSDETFRSDYFPGRVKPELVAPLSASSWSTGAGAGLAALLCDHANSISALNVAFDESEVMKAILLAGATRTQFDSWNRTTSRPLDPDRGAGEIHIANSYQILDAGRGAPGSISTTGWDFRSISSFQANTRSYNFSIPNGLVANDFTVALTWHHDPQVVASVVTDSSIAELSLSLSRLEGSSVIPIDLSDSPDNNIELIFQRNLPAGNYRLTVEVPSSNFLNNETTEYGLAWQTQLGQGPIFHTSLSPSSLPLVTVTGLQKGRTHVIERTDTLDPPNWQALSTFSAANWSLHTFEDPAGTSQSPDAFYRLRWDLP